MSVIDEHIGRRVRNRRAQLQLTQLELAKRIGLTHQMIYKLECGAVRMSAENLWLLSAALDAPVSFFFDGFDKERELRRPVNGRSTGS